MNLLCSWSGGKDSCFSLMQMSQRPTTLLNVLNEKGQISRSHGLDRAILQAQANAMNVPIEFFSTTWDHYTEKYVQKLQQLSEKYQLTDVVFGDIDILPHRDWNEKVCKESALTAHLPLWQQGRKQLVCQMIDAGIKAMIVSCNAHLGSEFLGRLINEETMADLETAGVDVCGENGEFHTVVLDCPLFKQAIQVKKGEKRNNGNGYWFLELQ